MAEIKKPEQGEVEREAFEAWVRTGEEFEPNWLNRRDFKDSERFGDYCNGSIEWQWRAWQARAALASATPPADSKCAYPKCVGGEPNDGSCCRTPWRENCQQPENCRPDCSALECGGLLPAAQAETDAERLDAARYREVRRGQHWSVINGIGDTLRADALDAAIDTVTGRNAT